MRRRQLLALPALLGASPAAAAPGITGQFTLESGTGRRVTTADFAGKYLLVMFGYTACPDVCPGTLYRIAQVLTALGPSAPLAAIFITVDPARDTPAIAARYAALFSPGITGLSGSPAQIHAAEAAFAVYASQPDPQTGAITHSALLYVLNPAGKFTAAFPDGTSAATLTKNLAALMAPP